MRGQINPDYELLPLRNHHKLTPDWNLETFPTQHLQKWRELNLSGVGAGAYAIRVSAPGHSLFYSGDIADFSDIAEAVQKEDLLILEGAHINLKKVIKWAGENGMERLVLTHLLPEAAPQASALIQEAQKSGLQITLAVDGLTINL